MIPIPPLLISSLTTDGVDPKTCEPASTPSKLWRFQDEYVLGTRLEVLVCTQSAVLAREAANAARQEIDRLDAVFNHRRGDSELSKLNHSGDANSSNDMFAVVQLAETWRRITRGAFDGRMGALLQLWQQDAEPQPRLIQAAIAAFRDGLVILDPVGFAIRLSSAIVLSLDAVAKGYIVDAALNAARRASPTIEGLAVGIGGDIRCWGKSPEPCGWRIGIPDPVIPAENAPLVDAIAIQNAAVATSGRGPRDFMCNPFEAASRRYRSTTISPVTGYPVRDVISASVVASHAADADALATACMVQPPEESIALVDRLDGVAARIVDARGIVHRSSAWSALQLAATTSATSTTAKSKQASPSQAGSTAGNAEQNQEVVLPAELRWPFDWELGVVYQAPEPKDERSFDFRTPYMVIWITDEQNRSVRTLFMVGTDSQWQRDNFIWWGIHRERATRLVELRSQATTLSGRYPIYWAGHDDNWKPVPLGKYILHLETSQERGKHHYRTMTIDIGRERFKMEMPSLPESGGISIAYGHYNDRFKPEY